MIDDVFQDEDGEWFFWDEWGYHVYGPFVTEGEARTAHEDYLKQWR